MNHNEYKDRGFIEKYHNRHTRSAQKAGLIRLASHHISGIDSSLAHDRLDPPLSGLFRIQQNNVSFSNDGWRTFGYRDAHLGYIFDSASDSGRHPLRHLPGFPNLWTRLEHLCGDASRQRIAANLDLTELAKECIPLIAHGEGETDIPSTATELRKSQKGRRPSSSQPDGHVEVSIWLRTRT